MNRGDKHSKNKNKTQIINLTLNTSEIEIEKQYVVSNTHEVEYAFPSHT